MRKSFQFYHWKMEESCASVLLVWHFCRSFRLRRPWDLFLSGVFASTRGSAVCGVHLDLRMYAYERERACVHAYVRACVRALQLRRVIAPRSRINEADYSALLSRRRETDRNGRRARARLFSTETVAGRIRLSVIENASITTAVWIRTDSLS